MAYAGAVVVWFESKRENRGLGQSETYVKVTYSMVEILGVFGVRESFFVGA